VTESRGRELPVQPGVIRWKGKKDASGHRRWKQLLKTNPNLDKKPIVERMIAEAQGKSS